MELQATSTLAFGQASTGSLSGTVVDTSGAVISGATVDIENAATGIKRTVSTNEAGLYSAPNLEPGSYNIIVSATGFSNTTTQGVNITVSFTTTATVELKPAGVEGEVVTVLGGDRY